MSSGGPSACRQLYDFVSDLENGIVRNEGRQYSNKINKIPLSPQLLIKFNEIEAWSLLDTGSQVTAMSEKFYEKLKSKRKLLEMPVSNILVSTAIGKKSTSVKKQILVEFEIDGFKGSQVCIIIPYLSSEVILGNDWNLKNGIIINYNSQSIQIRDKQIASSAVLFERSVSDKLHTAQKDDMTYIYVTRVHEVEPNGAKNKDEKNKILFDYDFDDDEKEITNDDEIAEIGGDNNLVNIYKINVNREKIEPCENDDDNYESKLSEELRSIAVKLTALTADEKTRIMNLIKQNIKLFIEKPGGALGYEYNIKLKTKYPAIYRSYSVPLHLREKAEIKIKTMKEAGIIERASGSVCNPLRWIIKSNGDLRPCLDARMLNNIIEDDHESPPIISEILQEFTNINYFSKFDLKNSYWQVSLHKDSRPYTAFIFDTAMYQFTRVPFGLKVAGSAFIRTLNKALECGSDKLRKALRIYVDDLLIGTDTFENHIVVLTELFSLLLRFNFTLNLPKCELCKQKILFLGFIISPEGVTPDPEKLKVIQEFEEPKNKKQLQQILGTCNFYRRFYIYYNDLIAPFRDLLKEIATWEWKKSIQKPL